MLAVVIKKRVSKRFVRPGSTSDKGKSKCLISTVPAGKVQAPVGAKPMVCPSGIASQRCLRAPSDHSGLLTLKGIWANAADSWHRPILCHLDFRFAQAHADGFSLDGLQWQARDVQLTERGIHIAKGGLALQAELGVRLSRAIRATGTFTIIALVQADAARAPGPARILSVAARPDQANLMIGQGSNPGNRTPIGFNIRLRHSGHSDSKGESGYRLVSPGHLIPSTAQMLAVVRTTDATTLFIDGAPTASLPMAGDLTNWDPAYPLVLGNDAEGKRPWTGTISRIIIAAEAWPVEVIKALSDFR